jgi:hypothetical protein
MNLNAMLAELDPMERTLRLDSLNRRSIAPFFAVVLAGVMLIGLANSLLLGGIVSAITHVVLRNRLARELSEQPPSSARALPYR